MLESFKKAEVKEEQTKVNEKEKMWKILAKYFLHGIGFSLLFTVLAIAWVVGLITLVMLGSLIGLIIGFVLLMLTLGFANSIITSFLWFPVKMSWTDTGLHGLVLFIVLLVIHGIFVVAPKLIFPGLTTTVTTFIIGSFLDGFIGKKVASWWKQEYEQSISKEVEAEWRDRKL